MHQRTCARRLCSCSDRMHRRLASKSTCWFQNACSQCAHEVATATYIREELSQRHEEGARSERLDVAKHQLPRATQRSIIIGHRCRVQPCGDGSEIVAAAKGHALKAYDCQCCKCLTPAMAVITAELRLTFKFTTECDGAAMSAAHAIVASVARVCPGYDFRVRPLC